MLHDPNGQAPEWWQWVVSGAVVATGVVLVATGVGGVAGSSLICAGVNSIVGSYVSEATGESSTAGWVGGMITGAFCGAGAGFAGELFLKATTATGIACLGNLAASEIVAFGSGFFGSVAGQIVSACIDGKDIALKDTVSAAVATGSINCLAALGSGYGGAFQGLPAISTTTPILANSLNTACTLVTEALCDVLSVVSSMVP